VKKCVCCLNLTILFQSPIADFLCRRSPKLDWQMLCCYGLIHRNSQLIPLTQWVIRWHRNLCCAVPSTAATDIHSNSLANNNDADNSTARRSLSLSSTLCLATNHSLSCETLRMRGRIVHVQLLFYERLIHPLARASMN
jgi:hypothetical protein